MLKLIMGSALLLSLSMTAKAEDYIKAEEYKERRTTLSEKLGGNHIVILFASEQLQRSHDTTFHYQPDVSLRYIAGATQIESIMLMSKSGANLSTMLFNKSSDPLHEKWEGRIASNDAVSKKTGINRVMPVESFERFAGGILDRASADTTLYLDLNHYHKLAGKGDSAAHEFAAKVRKLYPHINIKSVTPAIKEMREVKSDAEIALMRKAVEISAKAHIAGIKRAKTATHEYQIEAAIEHVVRDLGAEGVGYGSIIGSAESSTILHYKTNQRPVEKNSIIMVDAAAEYRGYSADISRTFPANGKFSKEQREIYQIVYDAEEAAIVKTKPGATYTELSNAALEIIGKGLLDLGLITKNEPSQIRWYYYHGLGHGIGLNVHDPVSFGGLKAGNIFTIEPGVYVNKRFVELEPGFQALPEAEQASILKAIEKYNNIGVRIEDDILVTETGYENLSVAAPRKIDEIEKLMSQ